MGHIGRIGHVTPGAHCQRFHVSFGPADHTLARPALERHSCRDSITSKAVSPISEHHTSVAKLPLWSIAHTCNHENLQCHHSELRPTVTRRPPPNVWIVDGLVGAL